MRFILKSAFWLGLIAFLIPFGGEPKETSANVTAIGVFLGAQQAIADFTGFCDRAPIACDTGREIAVFAGERIGDGIEMAYALVEGRIGEPREAEPAAREIAAAPVPAPSQDMPTDPLATGAVTVGQLRLPLAYTPPKRPLLDPARFAGPATHAPAAMPEAQPLPLAGKAAPHARPAPAVPAIPTPAPRA